MNDPLVSIVVPMFNAESTIGACLKSVFDQSYSNYEILIVNDGSQDGSLELVSQIVAGSSKVITVISQSNQGVSAARNNGMRKAKGEFIAFLDSDDEWESNKLKEQVSAMLKEPEIALLATMRNGETNPRFFLRSIKSFEPITSRMLLYKNFFSPPTVMLRRKVCETEGYFDESQRFAEEGNYWIRICKKNKCALLNKSLVTTGGLKPYFGHSGLSSNLSEMEKGELKNLRDALDLKVIGRLEYGFLVIYSLIKYLRRIIIVKLRS